ncbi:MAG: hypothetical protein AB2598_07235 [Candidatus Thiodiazotropha sp.]
MRNDIRLLTRGVVLPELRDLDELSRQMVLKELRSIMAVYGDGCPVTQPTLRENGGPEHGHRKKKTAR